MDDAYNPHIILDKWMKVWDLRGSFEASSLTGTDDGRDRSYVVSMLPYPSGDLHMGHAEVYSISDAMARYLRLRGADVLNAIGWDSFGLPAENAALKRGLHPRTWTYENIEVQAESFRRMGISFDWRTRLHTSDPEYYRWNQWLFLRLREHGLAYRKEAAVNWCSTDQTVLANEQVVDGKCERCGTVVIQRALTQWFFKTTAYAQRLLDDMAELEGKWPDDILAMQRNWIGRSEGAHVDFAVEGRAEPLRVFTTRPDTLFGATFMVAAVDSAIAEDLCAPENRESFEAYKTSVASATDIDRLATNRPKTGVPLGRYAINPVNGERIPIYASDYVLADYGTGVIMAVPAHDQRDADFAVTLGLPVREVIVPAEAGEPGVLWSGPGTLVSSGAYDGHDSVEAGTAIVAELEAAGRGCATVNYRLRDWLLSRQRFWGTPIPIVHCPACGEVPVPDEQLPVVLPEDGYELKPTDGRSPLATAEAWVAVDCPACGGPASRDTDTMDTFVDSSWYFLRYPNPDYTDGPFDPAGIARWLPIDEYIGGKEHATGHLMYARFMTKALHDLGLLPFVEPFTRLTNQGQVVMDGKAMSKSLGNLVNLQEQIGLYGPDAVRVTMVFAGPPEDDIDWADVSPAGAVKWLGRVWRLAGDLPPAADGELVASELRREVHRLVADTTTLMDAKRLNVAIAQLMKLTTVLRRAVDAGQAADPGVREGAQMLVRMLSCFAPFTAEEAWERLGKEASVIDHGWPDADPELVARDTAVCVVQVNGKLRDRLDVPADITDADLQALALGSEKVVQDVGDATVTKVIVRAPKLVNIVVTRS
ncbi:leucine--tRNA ligase [Longispora sp. K20-0274]|uniref:leucine--tRNA ligase n=1 Tax=Longispora sp. K20-0274 TaxID=3088255 RepID=UPI00399A43A1